MLSTSIKKVYVLLDEIGKDSFKRFQEGFVNLFPYLDISSDIYLVSKDIQRDFFKMKEIVEKVGLILQRYSFYRVNIHPVHPLPSGDLPKEIYNDFFRIISPFNREGYLHQGVSRFMVLPILIVEEKDDVMRLNLNMEFLRDRLMIPSIYIEGGVSPGGIKDIVSSDKERIYLELSRGGKQERVIDTLWIHAVFDDLITWANAPVKGHFPGCFSITLREKDGGIYNCFRSIFRDQPALNLYSGLSLPEMLKILEDTGNKGKDCLNCGAETVTIMKNTLKLNDREEEVTGISFHLGMEMVEEKDYERALEQFDQVLESRNGFEDMGAVLLAKALCLLRRNEIEDAEAVLDEVEKHIPSSPMIFYYRGLCEFELRDYIEAIDRFHDALKLESNELPLGDVYFYMGLSHINIEEYDDGLTMMTNAERFFEDKAPVYYYMGICYMGMQNLDTALDYLKKALASGPHDEDLSSICFHIGLCYKEMGRYEEAISGLKRARDAEEDRKDIHNLMGFCYFKLKEHDQAVQCFMRAVEIDPKSAIDYANIGVNLKEKGEEKKAIPMFKKALSLDPTIGFARKHLSEISGEM